MAALYGKPLRVYLLLGGLALWGLISGFKLPVSLFPISGQSTINVSLSYGSYSPQQFFETLGRDLEPRLQSARADNVAVEKIESNYSDRSVQYLITFGWGVDAEEARKTIETIATSYISSQELSIRRSLSVGTWHENQGFLAISFYSPLRSLDSLYDTLLPFTTPIAAAVPDAASVGLYNPSSKEISVKLSPEKLALYHLTTSRVENVIREAVLALNGGTMRIGDKDFEIDLPKTATSVETLSFVRVSSISETPVLLKDIAQISVTVSKESERKFKTSGVDSLILFADPKEGGNIKRMADDIMAELEKSKHSWPSDIEYRILVNPSDFINRSIMSVIKEVGLAAFLAVLVLFFFIGSFRNVATAAIEIPLSLVMAFILMKLTGMNLNLISLGGLALSAGMNVDASVVVLENIFRHLEGKPKNMPYSERLDVVLEAVREVRLPIIASTIASLVVFMPLVFTKGLTNSLLGDLAKAVIFSHGLSAIVALVLVPTIRLQLMRSGEVSHAHSPIEGLLVRVENFYRKTLTSYLKSPRLQILTVLLVMISLPALVIQVVPKLKREVIGRPETDWLMVGLNSPTISSTQRMESEINELEADLFKTYGDKIQYTFTQVWSRGGNVMMHLNSRKEVDDLLKKAEDKYKNTATIFYWVDKWNPSELHIPDPPDFKLEIIGGSPEERLRASEDISTLFQDEGIFDKRNWNPAPQRSQYITIDPFSHFTSDVEVLSRYDLSHYLRTATEGTYVETVAEGLKSYPIYLRFPDERTASLEQLKALPIGFEERLLSLGSLASFSMKPRPPLIHRENQSTMVVLTARMNKANAKDAERNKMNALNVIGTEKQKFENIKNLPASDKPSFNLPVPDVELQDALEQLKVAVLISAILIFITMVLQLGDIVQASLVMISVPLGILGVICSLYLFNSTLSLNSGLGTILLNGIAVANSIILVDFIQKLFSRGMKALDATVKAATTRLRPILMTSLTTVLGMLPVALGLGEGGKILQPLGVAVCGGLWISALMTLYIVPALQYQYLRRKENNQENSKETQSGPAIKAELADMTFEAQP